MSMRVSNGKGKLYDTDGRQVIATVAYQIWREPATEHSEEQWWALEHTIGEQGKYMIELQDGRRGTCFIEVRKAQWVPGLLTFYRYSLKGIGALT